MPNPPHPSTHPDFFRFDIDKISVRDRSLIARERCYILFEKSGRDLDRLEEFANLAAREWTLNATEYEDFAWRILDWVETDVTGDYAVWVEETQEWRYQCDIWEETGGGWEGR